MSLSTASDASGLSPVEVEQKLLDLVDTLSKAVVAWRDAYVAMKKAEREFDIAYAESRVDIDSSIPYNDRKFHADLATKDERIAKDDAETVFKYADQRLTAVHKAISVMQSLNKSMQVAYANGERSSR